MCTAHIIWAIAAQIPLDMYRSKCTACILPGTCVARIACATTVPPLAWDMYRLYCTACAVVLLNVCRRSHCWCQQCTAPRTFVAHIVLLSLYSPQTCTAGIVKTAYCAAHNRQLRLKELPWSGREDACASWCTFFYTCTAYIVLLVLQSIPLPSATPLGVCDLYGHKQGSL